MISVKDFENMEKRVNMCTFAFGKMDAIVHLDAGTVAYEIITPKTTKRYNTLAAAIYHFNKIQEEN